MDFFTTSNYFGSTVCNLNSLIFYVCFVTFYRTVLYKRILLIGCVFVTWVSGVFGYSSMVINKIQLVELCSKRGNCGPGSCQRFVSGTLHMKIIKAVMAKSEANAKFFH